ncbi:MAG: Gingipain R2 [Chloroflexi bacterium]|nr:Gingipain R2 [Chloroflexota bacterium]
MKRIIFLFLVASITFSGSLPTSTHALTSEDQPPPGLRLVHESPDSLVFEVNTPGYEVNSTPFSETIAHQIQIPRGQTLAQAGFPELSFYSTLINIPSQAEVHVQITAQDSIPLPGPFYIPPAPSPLPPEGDLSPGQTQRVPKESIYAQDTLFPENPVQLGEDAWMRDQRLVPLRVFPFQYNPVQGDLVWYKTLRVEITFSETARNAPSASPLGDVSSGTTANTPQAQVGAQSSQVPLSTPLTEPTLTETAYKITVNQDGIYRVTYADLQGAGMDVDNVDPAQFKLTCQGQEIAIHVEGEGDNGFDDGDTITFYGQKFRGDRLATLYATSMKDWTTTCPNCEIKDLIEKYTDENVYWLHLDPAGGARMGTSDGTPDGSTVPDYYMATAHAEESNEWYTHHFSSADTWLWEKVRDTATYTYEVTLVAVADTAPVNPVVSGELISRQNTAHDTHIFLNRDDTDPSPVPVDESTWSGIGDHDFSSQVALSDLQEGVNQLLFRSENNDYLYFNWFEVEYPRQFQAENNQLHFERDEAGSNWQYEIGNFTSLSADVYDITDPISPIRITGATFNSGTLTFTASHSAEADYFAAGGDGIQSPGSITSYTPPDFATLPEADYIFITPPEFETALDTLATHRQNQGLSTMIVDINDLYNTFNYGIYHTIAIKNFLAYTFSNWNTPPSYVLLVGNGHWNLKGYTDTKYGAPSPNYMLPNLAFVDPWQGEVDSANLLATLVGDDPLPDLAIGRIPISSEAELNTYIDKVTTYEQSGFQDWQSNIIQVSDDVPDDAGNFVASSDALVDTYITPSQYEATKIYLGEDCTAIGHDCSNADGVTAAILDTLNNTGASLMTFIGHGSIERWTHEQIFVSGDVPNLTNIDQLPIALSLDCLDAYWVYPNTESLIGELVRATNGGAVGAFSPTGLGVGTGHDALAEGFYEALITNNVTDFGAVTLASKLYLYQTGNNFDLLHTFTLFGDPALQIQVPPYYKVFLPFINRNP